MSEPTHQLRSYQLHPGTFDTFVDEWRSQILPLRRRFGFEVVGAWANREEETFVWLLAYDGPEGFAARDAEYYDSPERAGLDPDPARHVARSELRLLSPVDIDR